MAPLQPDIERRALQLYERLSERPGDQRFRQRLLGREPAAVLHRIEALERSAEAGRRSLPTIAEVLAAPPVKAPDRVGPFRLLEQIGEGGMGQVWRAVRDDGLYEQRVAVKLLHAHLAPLAAARFVRERQILAQLEHPGVARLIDGGVTEDGAAYLVMEYVDGRHIDLAAAEAPLAGRIALFAAAAEAVQAAHQKLIVHADLKPSNILVDAEGRVKLLDFGIARLLAEDDASQSPTPMTEAFASPARRAGGAPGVADDVFALGVLLGDLAGSARDRDIAAVAAKATAPEPQDRYGSVAALAADLERWRDGYPVSAGPDTVRYRVGKFLRRHRLGVGATASAMLLLAGTAGVATANYLTAERARAEATRRFEDLHGVARYLLFDLSDRLERQPQSLPLRAEVAQVSQGYLDRLARSRRSPELTRESVEGLLRLAERQGAPGRPNLGQPEKAKANLAQAYLLAAALPPAEGARLAARVRLDQAALATMVDNDLPASERLLADARRLIGPPERAPGGLGGDYFRELSALRQWQGRYGEGAAAAQAGLRAPPPADPVAARLSQARLYDLLAEATYYDGRPGEAEAPYRRQMEILADTARRWPGDPAVARRLARARWALGTTLLDLDRPREAYALLRQGAQETAAIADADLADADAARMHRIMIDAEAQSLAALGRRSEAIELLKQGVAARQALWRERPAETMRQRDYAVALVMLADIEAAAGRPAEACGHYREVEAVFAQLARAGRATSLDADSTLKRARDAGERLCP